jgi:hypothetical protein
MDGPFNGGAAPDDFIDRVDMRSPAGCGAYVRMVDEESGVTVYLWEPEETDGAAVLNVEHLYGDAEGVIVAMAPLTPCSTSLEVPQQDEGKRENKHATSCHQKAATIIKITRYARIGLRAEYCATHQHTYSLCDAHPYFGAPTTGKAFQ